MIVFSSLTMGDRDESLLQMETSREGLPLTSGKKIKKIRGTHT